MLRVYETRHRLRIMGHVGAALCLIGQQLISWPNRHHIINHHIVGVDAARGLIPDDRDLGTGL